jgi:hypothetical protein
MLAAMRDLPELVDPAVLGWWLDAADRERAIARARSISRTFTLARRQDRAK